MNAEQQALLIENLVGAMKPVTCDVQRGLLGHFFKADPLYGASIAKGLGIDPGEIG